MREGDEVRGRHPYVYRSGEWARVAQITFDPEHQRECWLVTFPDGDADWWVANDPVAEYEVRPH